MLANSGKQMLTCIFIFYRNEHDECFDSVPGIEDILNMYWSLYSTLVI